MTPKGYLIGTLTSDPKSGGNGANSWTRFSVACNENYSKANSTPKAHFFNCISWGKVAQFVQSFLKKGNKIFAEYSLTTGSYNNAEGKEIKTFDLVVFNVESLSKMGNKDEVKLEDDENISIDDIYSKD